MLYEQLVEQFGFNEPIMSNEIKISGYSRSRIYRELIRLCREGKISRFQKGIYYIPKNTILGKTLLSPMKMIEKKYIRSGEEVYGYYSGVTLLNALGLSTQVPAIIEVKSNKVHGSSRTKCRKVLVGKQRVILQHGPVEINRENASTLSLLEIMEWLPVNSLNDEKKRIIRKYIRDNKITKSNIMKYAGAFSDVAVKTLDESGILCREGNM